MSENTTSTAIQTTTQRTELAQRGMSRRSFIQGMFMLPLMAATASSTLAIAPTEAEAASATKKVSVGYVDLYVPVLWKKRMRGCGSSHGSGIYNYDMVYRGTNVSLGMLVEGNFKRGQARGKTRSTYDGDLCWTVKRGKVAAVLYATNVPLIVWDTAHGSKYYKLTKKQSKELLKLSTGGKTSYAKLVKWSRTKAKRQGERAVRRWFGSKIAKKAKIR